jgi:hypothetical protein
MHRDSGGSNPAATRHFRDTGTEAFGTRFAFAPQEVIVDLKRALLGAAWLFVFLSNMELSAQEAPTADSASRFRAQIGGSPIGTDLEVRLEGGERVEGELAEIETESFVLWVEPDEEIKKQFRLTSGRVKKRMRYDRVVALRGAASAVAFSGEQLSFQMRVGDSVRIHTPEGDEVRGRVDEFDGPVGWGWSAPPAESARARRRPSPP